RSWENFGERLCTLSRRSAGAGSQPGYDVLAHHEDAGGFLMEIVKKVITPRLQWAQPDNSFAVSGHDLLHTQTHALELHGRRIEIFYAQLDRHLGRGVDFGGLKAVILHTNAHTRRLLRTCGKAGCGEDERSGNIFDDVCGHRHSSA